MSTTYYIRKRLPEDKKKLAKELIDKDMYSELENLLNEHSEEHEIGHRAGGWQFLWHPCNPYLKELTRKGIEDLVNQDDVIIYNEYDEIEDKNEFLDMAFNWDVDGWDSNSYREEHPKERNWSMTERQADCIHRLKMLGHKIHPVFDNIYQTDFKNDGLRWTILT